MPESPSDPQPTQAKPDNEPNQPKVTATDRADLIAVGIGCAVFLIMFIAIVVVAISRGEG
jgi:hypothetical protein